MHTHKRSFLPVETSARQYQVHVLIDAILVGVEPKFTEIRLYRLLGDALDRALVAQAVANEIGDGADLEVVSLSERFQLRPARHRAVVVHDFTQHSGRLKA